MVGPVGLVWSKDSLILPWTWTVTDCQQTRKKLHMGYVIFIDAENYVSCVCVLLIFSNQPPLALHV